MLFLCLVFLFWTAPAQAADVGPAYAVVNCKVVPVSGPVLEKGTIVIRDGLIEAVGPADKISVPEDAEVIDGQGLTAYPGLLDAHSQVFLEPAFIALASPPCWLRQPRGSSPARASCST